LKSTLDHDAIVRAKIFNLSRNYSGNSVLNQKIESSIYHTFTGLNHVFLCLYKKAIVLEFVDVT
jgi:hypothetical protein